MSVAKRLLPVALVPSLVFAPALASADHNSRYDQARVIGVTPQYEMVSYTVPTEQCRTEQVPVRYDDGYHARGHSYTVPIVGAIIGGAVGNAVMHGKTRKRVGTAVGAVLGASIGADVARNRAARPYPSAVSYREETVCQMVDEVREERRISGYEVRYRYAGETYVTYMDRDPGSYLRVRVDVTPA